MSARVLFAIHSVRDPATAVYMNVFRRAEDLREGGHQVDIIAPEDVGLPVMSGVRPLLYGAVLVARGRLTSYDLVVFHSHCGWAFLLARPFMASARRVAAVTAFHGLEPLYHGIEQQELARAGRKYGTLFRLLHTRVLAFLTRLGCRRSDAVFCLNTAERDYLVGHKWCRPGRAVIVRNGVEHALFATRRHEQRAATLLFVGQWIPRKGTRYLAEAFRLIAARDPRLILVCAGTGKGAADVRADFAAEVRDRVRVHPRVDRSTLAGLLRQADVFVFPTLFEGSSGALLEAMAASLGIVATPAGSAADILRDGHNAIVVPFADSRALATAVERLVANGELRDRLARAAHESALDCEWSRTNADYTECLVEAMQRHGSAVRVTSR